MTDQSTFVFGSTPDCVVFEPTRAAGLARLNTFAPRAGKHYAGQRNYDYGPEKRGNVSLLSPWLRHRLITEEEVLRATLARHAPLAAEKFVQEVFWRGYFKGWLEQRPSVWRAYQKELQGALKRMGRDRALVADYGAAVGGATGIDGFDDWARELVETGYLHNHARMWFASIWIFTLRLPWELGADFFLRHLADGDPASNTLSWRWVAGLHTRGKTYQARVSNIAKYTDGRFRPEYQLSNTAEPLVEQVDHPRLPIPPADGMPKGDFLLLVTEEDCQIDAILPRSPAGVAGLLVTQARSLLEIGNATHAFAAGAVNTTLDRLGGAQATEADDWAKPLIMAAQAAGVAAMVTGYAPVGPVADRLRRSKPALQEAGITLHQIRRPYDDLVWPHAARGFFGLKKKIPTVLDGLGLC